MYEENLQEDAQGEKKKFRRRCTEEKSSESRINTSYSIHAFVGEDYINM